MAKVLQLRRGTTAQNDAFTGAEGEVTVDTEKKTLRVHDGATAGGTVLAKKSEIPDITGKADKASLAPVATSGSYADLTNKPTIPTKVSAFENDKGYLTSHQSLEAYATKASLATVATSGKYADLSGTPTIPDISGKADKASLAAVATTGNYNDLTHRPNIPNGDNYVPKIGDRGEFRGYASQIGSRDYISDNTLIVNKDIPDFFGAQVHYTKISVPNGGIEAWVKSVEIGSNIALTSVTLDSRWKWENGLEPFGEGGNLNGYNSLLIFRWTGMSGIASFLSPYIQYLTEQQATNEYAKKTEIPDISGKADISSLSTVATSGSYADLTNKPTIPTKVSAFENDKGYLTQHQSLTAYAKKTDLSTVATSGSYTDLSNKPTLATVATSGSYNDLTGKPTIPKITSGTTDLTAGSSALATGDIYLVYE